jgi:hypothetical protein
VAVHLATQTPHKGCLYISTLYEYSISNMSIQDSCSFYHYRTFRGYMDNPYPLKVLVGLESQGQMSILTPRMAPRYSSPGWTRAGILHLRPVAGPASCADGHS